MVWCGGAAITVDLSRKRLRNALAPAVGRWARRGKSARHCCEVLVHIGIEREVGLDTEKGAGLVVYSSRR